MDKRISFSLKKQEILTHAVTYMILEDITPSEKSLPQKSKHWGKKRTNTVSFHLHEAPAEAHGEGNGNPLQYFCLENPMDGGAW